MAAVGAVGDAEVGAGVRRVDRVGIRRLVTSGPDLAGEVVAALDPGGREQPVEGGVAGVVRTGAVGGLEGGLGAGPTQCGVRVVRAAVQDGDVHALALPALVLDHLAAHVRDGLGEVERVVPDGDDRDDVAALGELVEGLDVSLEHDDVRGLAGAAEDRDVLVDRLGLRDDAGLLRARGAVGVLLGVDAAPGLEDGRRSGQAHDDALRASSLAKALDLGLGPFHLVCGAGDGLVDPERLHPVGCLCCGPLVGAGSDHRPGQEGSEQGPRHEQAGPSSIHAVSSVSASRVGLGIPSRRAHISWHAARRPHAFRPPYSGGRRLMREV